ncbi:MAG: hypothetical protein R2856_34180 [Caldilineaceae bacterium]
MDGAHLEQCCVPSRLELEIDISAKSIELHPTGDTVVTAPLTTTLADGGVYTFLSTDHSNGGFPVTLLQHQDARYSPSYLAYYTVDQAQMNEQWQMKLVGDTDNTFYQLSVLGPDSPPILGSVAVDAANLSAAQVSWQLTSDNRPTLVSIFANPGAISATLPLTNADGSVDCRRFRSIPGCFWRNMRSTIWLNWVDSWSPSSWT